MLDKLSNLSDFEYLVIVLAYLAMVFITYEIFRLYAFKGMLDKLPTAKLAMNKEAWFDRLVDVKVSLNDDAYRVFFSYIWPITIAIYMYVMLFRFAWRIIASVNYTEKEK